MRLHGALLSGTGQCGMGVKGAAGTSVSAGGHLGEVRSGGDGPLLAVPGAAVPQVQACAVGGGAGFDVEAASGGGVLQGSVGLVDPLLGGVAAAVPQVCCGAVGGAAADEVEALAAGGEGGAVQGPGHGVGGVAGPLLDGGAVGGAAAGTVDALAGLAVHDLVRGRAGSGVGVGVGGSRAPGVPAVPGVGVEADPAELVGGPVRAGLVDRDAADGVVLELDAAGAAGLVADRDLLPAGVGVPLEVADLGGGVQAVPAVDLEVLDVDVLGVRQGIDA